MMLTKIPAPKSFSACAISTTSKGDLWVRKMCWDNAGGGVGDKRLFLDCKKHRLMLKIILEEKQKLFKLRKCNIHVLHKYTLGITWLLQETAFGFH